VKRVLEFTEKERNLSTSPNCRKFNEDGGVYANAVMGLKALLSECFFSKKKDQFINSHFSSLPARFRGIGRAPA
jgi:hypothetical protein